jgi:hypothetical protein
VWDSRGDELWIKKVHLWVYFFILSIGLPRAAPLWITIIASDDVWEIVSFEMKKGFP